MTDEDKNGQIHKVKTLSITTFFKKISHRRSKYNTKFLKVCAKKVSEFEVQCPMFASRANESKYAI